MDTIKFMKEKKRMCNSYSECTEICPLKKLMDENRLTCLGYCFAHPEEAVSIVEKWSAEHPVKTRQSEFLEIYPRARCKPDGILSMCPRHLDDDYKNDHECSWSSCVDCRKEYWLAEVDVANTNLIDREEVIKVIDKHTNEDGALDEDISVILEEIS